jgi:hypothetical protein
VLEDIPAGSRSSSSAASTTTSTIAARRREQTGRRYGELSGRRRDGLTDDSEMSPDIDLLGCQLQSGGTGIDLTRSHTGIYYSLDFNLGDYLQSRKRLHREGQRHVVTFVHLLAEDTVDRAIYGALRKREETLTGVPRLHEGNQAVSIPATAAVDPAPTAIEPSRVLVVSDDQQRLIIETIAEVLAPTPSPTARSSSLSAEDNGVPWRSLQPPRDLVAYGEEYANPADELVRTTLRKRRLETETRRCNQRHRAHSPRWSSRSSSSAATPAASTPPPAPATASTARSGRRSSRARRPRRGEARRRARPRRRRPRRLRARGLQHQHGQRVLPRADQGVGRRPALLPEHERAPRARASFLPPELAGSSSSTTPRPSASRAPRS